SAYGTAAGSDARHADRFGQANDGKVEVAGRIRRRMLDDLAVVRVRFARADQPVSVLDRKCLRDEGRKLLQIADLHRCQVVEQAYQARLATLVVGLGGVRERLDDVLTREDEIGSDQEAGALHLAVDPDRTDLIDCGRETLLERRSGQE